MAKQFVLVIDPNPTVYRVFTIASQAYSIGDCVQLSRTAATVTPATSSTIDANVIGVAVEAKTSSDTSLLCCVINDQQVWQADNTNATNVAHNYQRMALSDKGTVNNTGTDQAGSTGIWTQLNVLSATRTSGQFNLQASVS